jgi:gliding motility-associated-like protein
MLLPVLVFCSLFCSAQGTWTQKTGLPFWGVNRAAPVAYNIANKGYLGTGDCQCFSVGLKDVGEYDPIADTWTQKANFGGGFRKYAVGFSIGNYGYTGTGVDSSGNYMNDLWKFDPILNTWTQMASPGPTGRAQAVGFAVGGKGYIGTGLSVNSCFNDLLEYDPVANTWTPKANFPGGFRRDIDRAVFVIGNKAYLGTGCDSSRILVPAHHNDFWEFDPTLNTWTQKPNFPGPPRRGAVGFSLCGYGFIGLGTDGTDFSFNDFWMYDTASNSWSAVTPFPGPARWDAASFVVNNNAYIATGTEYSPFFMMRLFYDLWEFSPPQVNPVISGVKALCIGDSITLTAGGGGTYSWSTGALTDSIRISPSATTTYSLTATRFCNSQTITATVPVITTASASFNYQFVPCVDNCFQMQDLSVNALDWSWNFGDGKTSTEEIPCHFYTDSSTYSVSLTINQGTNCASTSTQEIPFLAPDNTTDVFIPNAFSPNGDGKNDRLRFYRRNNYCLEGFHIAIYDRWGEKVFETTNISDSWDGTRKGEPLNDGVFVYYCSLSTHGEQRELKGNISLLR